MSGFKLKLEASAVVLKAALVAGTLGKDKGFVESLLKSYAKYNSLSPKQEVWFHKLAGEHSGEPKAAPAAAPAPVVGQFEGVYALFAKAKEKLKFPKINLSLPGENGEPGLPVVLNMAGPKSKKPGVINVTNGGKFATPGNKWYGRVNLDGSMETPSGVEAMFPEFEAVKAVLKLLAAEPAKVAAEHGKLTGRCCFCNHHLSDEDHSTAVGYGPTCAKNFGLYAEWKAGENLFETLAKEIEAGGKTEHVVKEDGTKVPVLIGIDPAAPGADQTAFVGMKKVDFNFDKAMIPPVEPVKPRKPVVTVVPGAAKDEDYLF